MFPATLIVILTLIAAPAFAQAPYVGAAIGMDVARFDHVEFPGSGDFDASGEAVAFSLRLGTPIGQNWGVELGFTYPSEIERENSQFPIPLLAAALAPGGIGAGIAVPPSNLAFPVFEATTEIERRNTTIESVAWFAQSVGSRVDLVYLGGVAFNRVTEEVTFGFNRRAIAIPLIVPTSTRSVSYDVGPLVGMEARIGLTDHVRLVPAFRLQSVGGSSTQGGWLLRPSAGLAWQF